MDTKASIQFGSACASFEGSEEFVSRQVDRFSELFAARGSDIISPIENSTKPETKPQEDAAAKPKKARSAGGSGSGCTAKVKALLKDGFFNSTKTAKVAADKLREQATPYPTNKVSAALITLARGKHLRRFQEGGDWQYIVP